MTLPTQYEIDRIQLIALSAYNIYNGTEESINWAMRDIAMFYKNYPEAMEKATQCIMTEEKPKDKEINALMIVALCFRGLDLLITSGETMVYDLAKAMIADIDIEKEFSKEIMLRSA